MNWSEIHANINNFERRLRLKEFFHQNNQTDSANSSYEVKHFGCKVMWTLPNERDAALDTFINSTKMSDIQANINDFARHLQLEEIFQPE